MNKKKKSCKPKDWTEICQTAESGLIIFLSAFSSLLFF